MKTYIKAAEETNGIFWIVDGELLAFPFYEGSTNGVAKSGNTYNHRKLWPDVAPRKYKNKPFDYFPRGRVEFRSNGQPVIYMNPNIDETYIPIIRKEFGLRSEPIVNYDNSSHYRCHLDNGYVPQR